MPLSRSGPMTGCIVECTITSTPCASFSTCADVDVGRGGARRALPASPPITPLPAGVATREEAGAPRLGGAAPPALSTPPDHNPTAPLPGGTPVLRPTAP